MPRTITEALAEADNLGRGPNATVNARVASLPAPITASFAAPSLRKAIAAALTQGTDPLLAARALKSEHLAIYERCTDLIAQAEKRAVALVTCANYIDGSSDFLPTGADGRLIDSCASVKAAKIAGFDVSPSLSEDMRDAARSALRRIKTASALNERRRAAWHVAYAKQMTTQMRRYAAMPGDARKQAIFTRSADRYAVIAHRASAAFTAFKQQHQELKDG